MADRPNRGGRPSKGGNRLSRTIYCRVREAEFSEIGAEAAAAGQPLGTYTRDLVMTARQLLRGDPEARTLALEHWERQEHDG